MGVEEDIEVECLVVVAGGEDAGFDGGWGEFVYGVGDEGEELAVDVRALGGSVDYLFKTAGVIETEDAGLSKVPLVIEAIEGGGGSDEEENEGEYGVVLLRVIEGRDQDGLELIA